MHTSCTHRVSRGLTPVYDMHTAWIPGSDPGMRVVCMLDTMRVHEFGLANVGVGGGLLSGGDVPPDEPGCGLAGRECAVRGVDERDRAAVNRAAGRVSGDAGAGGGAGGPARAAAVADARAARDGRG